MRLHTVSALTALAAFAGAASADTLVAVPPFAGPSEAAELCHAAVVDAVKLGHRVVAGDEITQAAALSDSDARDPQLAARLADLTGADAFIIGRVAETDTGWALTLLAREIDVDEPAKAMIVSLESDEITPAERERILQFAVGAIAGDDIADADDDEDESDDEAETAVKKQARPKKPSRLVLSAAVGLGASARRLSFNAEPGLSMSPGLAGNPSAGLRLDVEAATRATPGVGVAASYEHSLGARVNTPQGLQIPVSHTRWSVAARGRFDFRGFEIKPSLGYSEIAYGLDVRPAGVLVPDATYAYIEAGADARYKLRGTALFAGGRYLHPISIGGITDRSSFGNANARGFEATGGLEFRASDRVWIRLTARYLRFALAFDGTGEMAMGLDDDPEMDVFGAIDAFVGGDAAVVFTL